MQLLNNFHFLEYTFGFFIGLLIGVIWGWQAHKVRIIRQINETTEKLKSDHIGPHRHDVPETTQVVNNKRYSSLDSKCIAQGSTMIGWAWLMQTNNNNYFIIATTVVGLQGIFPQTQEEAIAFYTSCAIREVPFEQVFPGVKIQDA